MKPLKIKKRSDEPKIPLKILFPEDEYRTLYTLAAMHQMTPNKYIVAVVLEELKKIENA